MIISQLYKDANKEKPSESYPQEQIDWINDKMKSQLTDDLHKQYEKIIDVADKMFGEENYVKAKDLYARATKFETAEATNTLKALIWAVCFASMVAPICRKLKT